MVRYKIETEGSPISIAYGLDEYHGFFLSVYDARLEYQAKESNDEVNKIALSVGLGEGDGSYFELHTEPRGFGNRVALETLAVFLRRYGVSEKQIMELFSRKPIGLPCQRCRSLTPRTCEQCHQAFYCDEACQAKDWPLHQFYCRLPFPAKETGEKSVYGILLTEDADNPVVVKVPIVSKYDENEGIYVYIPNERIFLGDEDKSSCYMTRNPLKPDKAFSDTLVITFRDNYLNDGSKTNKVVHKITNGQNSHDWRGPILITKIKGTNLDVNFKYKDIVPTDFEDVIDFLMSYGRA